MDAVLIDSSCDSAASELLTELTEWKCQALLYKTQHRRAIEREEHLKDEVKDLREQVRELRKTVEELCGQIAQQKAERFGRKTERSATINRNNKRRPKKTEPRKRGQQEGNKGPGRRDYSHLPTTTEVRDLAEEQKVCGQCNLPLKDTAKTEDSEQVEIEVQAHRRVIKRKIYRKNCRCEDGRQLVTAPVAPRLIPKSRYGVSVWVELLISKFQLQQPTNRFIQDMALRGLDLPPGTLAGGLEKLVPLLEPIYEAIAKKNLEAEHWNVDETRWNVFEKTEGKEGYRWWLWVVRSTIAVVYIVDPSRATKVLIDYMGTQVEGTISCDRYSAYKCFERQCALLWLAHCWAHMRREFIRVQTGWKSHEAWSTKWIERIATLYRLNDARLEVIEDDAAFSEATNKLRSHTEDMLKTLQKQQKTRLAKCQRKVLKAVANNWAELTRFVDIPTISPDNNAAERSLRTPVVGRKNYYGSGSVRSAKLAMMMFTIFATLRLWNVNTFQWLTQYLTACAENQGQVPEDWQRYLPWHKSPIEIVEKLPPDT